MNTAIPPRAAERSRRIFFPSTHPAAVVRRPKPSLVVLHLARLLASRIQGAVLRLRG